MISSYQRSGGRRHAYAPNKRTTGMPKAKQIIIDGITYNSRRGAARHLGVHLWTLRVREERGTTPLAAPPTPYHRRHVRDLTLGLRTMSVAAWAQQPDVAALGLRSGTIWTRVATLGWDDEAALTTPPRRHDGSGPTANKALLRWRQEEKKRNIIRQRIRSQH